MNPDQTAEPRQPLAAQVSGESEKADEDLSYTTQRTHIHQLMMRVKPEVSDQCHTAGCALTCTPAQLEAARASLSCSLQVTVRRLPEGTNTHLEKSLTTTCNNMQRGFNMKGKQDVW